MQIWSPSAGWLRLKGKLHLGVDETMSRGRSLLGVVAMSPKDEAGHHLDIPLATVQLASKDAATQSSAVQSTLHDLKLRAMEIPEVAAAGAQCDLRSFAATSMDHATASKVPSVR